MRGLCLVAIAVLAAGVWMDRISKRALSEPPAASARRSALVPRGDAIDTSIASSVHRTLATHSGSRSGLARTLLTLNSAGLLHESALAASFSSVRRKLNEAVQSHVTANTPYGSVVKSLRLNIKGCESWDYCCPMAFITYLSSLCKPFYDVMEACSPPGQPLRIVIYVDECEPGNPLRPEKSRSLQCVYWAIADWPQWLLQRTGAWFTLGFIRSTFADKLPGGVSELMRRIVHIFWPEDGNSFARGVVIRSPQGASIMIKSIFGGFLADDAAHKYIGNFKGATGTHPNVMFSVCVSCLEQSRFRIRFIFLREFGT